MSSPHTTDGASDAPEVSVVTSVYNGARYLEESVSSILGQTFTDFEFLIVDDGSTDETPALLRTCSDPRARVIRNERNVGVSHSVNRALESARGRYVARHDADDVSVPSRIARQVAFLNEHPEIGVVGAQMEWIDETDRPLEMPDAPLEHSLIAWEMVFRCPLFQPTVLIRKSVLDAPGAYDPTLVVAHDYDLWARLMPVTRMANLPERLVRYRVHSNSVSQRHGADREREAMRVRRAYVSRVLGRETDAGLIEAMHRSQISLERLTDEQVRHVVGLLFEMYEAMLDQGFVVEDERESVRTAMIERVVRAAQCAPGCVPRASLSGEYWRSVLPRPVWRAVWGLRHPMKAWRKRRRP